MQELRVEDAYRALRESCPQFHSQRMELYQVNQLSDHCQREKSCFMHRIGQKENISSRRSCEESSRIEELKKMCSIEAE